MSEVKRYVTTCDCMRPASWGDYVSHDDYAALEAECERLQTDYTEACDDAMAVARKLRAALAELAALKAVPDGVEVAGYACAGQIEVLGEVPLTGGMKVSGRERERYTVPLMTVAQHNAIVAKRDARIEGLEAACERLRDMLAGEVECNVKLRLELAALSAPAPAAGPDVPVLVEALRRIERWDGFPATGKTWPESGNPMSYAACYGSNGERDFMRQVAAQALALAAHKAGGGK